LSSAELKLASQLAREREQLVSGEKEPLVKVKSWPEKRQKRQRNQLRQSLGCKRPLATGPKRRVAANKTNMSQQTRGNLPFPVGKLDSVWPFVVAVCQRGPLALIRAALCGQSGQKRPGSVSKRGQRDE